MPKNKHTFNAIFNTFSYRQKKNKNNLPFTKEDKRFTTSLINSKICLIGRKKFCYLNSDNKIYTVYKDNRVKGTLVYIKTKREMNALETPISYILEGIILVKHRKYFGYNMTKTIYKEGKILYEQKHLYGYGDIVKSL